MDERNWCVDPGLGIGPFRFGTPRAELRASLGSCRPFRRGPDAADLTDDYPDGVQLTCAPDEGLYCIEIHQPVGVHYLGVPLHGRARDVVAALRAAGVRVARDDSGWVVAGGAALLFAESSVVDVVTAYSPRRAGARIAEFDAGPDAAQPLASYTVLPGAGLTTLALGTPRDEVRATRNGGVAVVGYPDSDTFFDEGITVEYDGAGRTSRITVTRAKAVLLGGINLLPSRPRTIADVRTALSAAGREVAEGEAALLLPGTGISVRTARPGPSRPVCAVSVSMPEAVSGPASTSASRSVPVPEAESQPVPEAESRSVPASGSVRVPEAESRSVPASGSVRVPEAESRSVPASGSVRVSAHDG